MQPDAPRLVALVPARGPERVRWWAELEEVLAADAKFQRADLTRFGEAPESLASWLDAYAERLREVIHRAVYGEPAP